MRLAARNNRRDPNVRGYDSERSTNPFTRASADSGSNFRIDSCQDTYNLSASALGVGTYRIDIKINGQVVGSATFQLK